MKSNIARYNKSRLFSYLSGLFPTFISYFLKRDKNLIILNSFHNKDFNDNTKYLFEYLIKNESQKKIRYIINDENKRKELINRYGNYFVETNSFAGKMYVLRAYLWFTNSFEFPVNGAFLSFRRKVIQLTHGAPIKNAGLCENDISLVKRIYYALLRTNISYVLSTASIFDDYIASHIGVNKRKVLTSSYPRYDPLFNGKFLNLQLDKEYKHILYAPTWRHYADVELFPFKDLNLSELELFLEKTKTIIYLRIHPRFENTISENLRNIRNIVLFSGKNYPDINDYLENFDALITDYSSILYDFMILDRPIFYFSYDYDQYYKEVGFSVDYKKFAIGYHSKSMIEFFGDIQDAFSKDSYKNDREKISELSSGKSNSNSRDLIELLKSKGIF